MGNGSTETPLKSSGNLDRHVKHWSLTKGLPMAAIGIFSHAAWPTASPYLVKALKSAHSTATTGVALFAGLTSVAQAATVLTLGLAATVVAKKVPFIHDRIFKTEAQKAANKMNQGHLFKQALKLGGFGVVGAGLVAGGLMVAGPLLAPYLAAGAMAANVTPGMTAVYIAGTCASVATVGVGSLVGFPLFRDKFSGPLLEKYKKYKKNKEGIVPSQNLDNKVTPPSQTRDLSPARPVPALDEVLNMWDLVEKRELEQAQAASTISLQGEVLSQNSTMNASSEREAETAMPASEPPVMKTQIVVVSSKGIQQEKDILAYIKTQGLKALARHDKPALEKAIEAVNKTNQKQQDIRKTYVDAKVKYNEGTFDDEQMLSAQANYRTQILEIEQVIARAQMKVTELQRPGQKHATLVAEYKKQQTVVNAMETLADVQDAGRQITRAAMRAPDDGMLQRVHKDMFGKVKKLSTIIHAVRTDDKVNLKVVNAHILNERTHLESAGFKKFVSFAKNVKTSAHAKQEVPPATVSSTYNLGASSAVSPSGAVVANDHVEVVRPTSANDTMNNDSVDVQIKQADAKLAQTEAAIKAVVAQQAQIAEKQNILAAKLAVIATKERELVELQKDVAHAEREFERELSDDFLNAGNDNLLAPVAYELGATLDSTQALKA